MLSGETSLNKNQQITNNHLMPVFNLFYLPSYAIWMRVPVYHDLICNVGLDKKESRNMLIVIIIVVWMWQQFVLFVHILYGVSQRWNSMFLCIYYLSEQDEHR